MQTLVIFILSFMLIGCAKTTDQKVMDAIDQALTYLSDEECDKAIDVLEEVGNQPDNAIYLEVLSSAYACRADFDMIDFISDDVQAIDTSSFEDIMKSLSILSLSAESTPDSNHYKDMRTAIGTILTDGDKQPSQRQRTDDFGPRKAGDTGIQVLVYSLVQLGKFINLYGDVNASGVKGAGSGTNACFIDYTYANAQIVRAATGGSCNGNIAGHAGLSITAPNAVRGNRRRCEGLMLFTNILDILNNLDVSTSDVFKDIATAGDEINDLRDTAIASDATLETLLYTTSQIECEKLMLTSTESDNMELIFALLFEAGLQ